MTPATHTLQAHELATDYSFSHPQFSSKDKVVMHYMLGQVDDCLLRTSNDNLHQQRPDADNWQHRLIVPDCQCLREQENLYVVGFFRIKKPTANAQLMNDFDKLLVAELPAHKGILCYCSMAMISGEYCNLVLFDSEDIKALWAKSDTHRFATQHLAPDYYAHVRIHNGVMAEGLSQLELHLSHTKYYNYLGDFWQAIRYYQGA